MGSLSLAHLGEFERQIASSDEIVVSAKPYGLEFFTRDARYEKPPAYLTLPVQIAACLAFAGFAAATLLGMAILMIVGCALWCVSPEHRS